MPVEFPPVHVPRPYALPATALAARVEVPTEDGAAIVAWTYAPEGVVDAPGTPFGIDLSAPPVLMLHGNGEEHGIFGPVIDAVCASGRAVIALDSRAQGQSTRGAARPLTYELMAADAIEACARLGVPEVHVLGFSDGGILGLLLARDWGAHVLSVTALGANLTPAGLPKEDTDWMAYAAAENRRWAAEGEEGATLEDGTPVPSPAEAARIAELLQLMVEQPQIDAASLASISCPVTVMVGEFDEDPPRGDRPHRGGHRRRPQGRGAQRGPQPAQDGARRRGTRASGHHREERRAAPPPRHRAARRPRRLPHPRIGALGREARRALPPRGRRARDLRLGAGRVAARRDGGRAAGRRLLLGRLRRRGRARRQAGGRRRPPRRGGRGPRCGHG